MNNIYYIEIKYWKKIKNETNKLFNKIMSENKILELNIKN